MIDPAAGLALRCLLAVVLATAAWHKGRGLRAFAAAVADYRLLPDAWSTAAARALLVAEGALAAGLVLPGAAQLASAGTAALLTVYAVAIAVNLGRGRRHIDCGCAGPARHQPLSGWLVVRNAALVAAALGAALPEATRPLGALDALTVVGSAASLLGVFVAADGLIAAWPETEQLRRTP